jgi:hypothetical protein
MRDAGKRSSSSSSSVGQSGDHFIRAVPVVEEMTRLAVLISTEMGAPHSLGAVFSEA